VWTSWESAERYNDWMAYERELELARDAARRAGELALQHSARGLTAETKADESPVTIADRECEKLIAGAIRDRFPDDGLLGEEGSNGESRNGRKWIIDPIDGTRDFLRNIPAWAVLIGLEVDGEVVAGVCQMPASQESYWAIRGGGAWRNGERIRASAIRSQSEALFCVNGINSVLKLPYATRLVDFAAGFWAIRSLGGCFDAMLVASGRADAWWEPTAAPWDLAALKVILEESGACFFNFDGGASIYGGNCIACAPGLEKLMRDFAAKA
jgi:histidinol phosphatase-like enzyme (inositol monophosphatase family)